MKSTFGDDLLRVYLFGSSLLGGLQKYSDLDLFVVIDRATRLEEKENLAANLLEISGIYLNRVLLNAESFAAAQESELVEAKKEIERLQAIIHSKDNTITTLENQLRLAESTLKNKQSTLTALMQDLAAKTLELHVYKQDAT